MPPSQPPVVRARQFAVDAWAKYMSLWRAGRTGIAIALLIPCCLCSFVYGGATELGIIEPPPTEAPRPMATPRPTRTARPTSRPRSTSTSRPQMATDEPVTSTPVRPTEAVATTAPVLPTAPPPTRDPNPRPDLSPDEDRDCGDFKDNVEAQNWYDYWRSENRDNPGGLDGDNDGEICEQGASGGGGAPAQIQPLIPQVPPPPAAPPPAAVGIQCGDCRTCGTFGTWREAQDYFLACGCTRMDGDGDGIACQSLPGAP